MYEQCDKNSTPKSALTRESFLHLYMQAGSTYNSSLQVEPFGQGLSGILLGTGGY